MKMYVKLAHKQACRNTLENTRKINYYGNSQFPKSLNINGININFHLVLVMTLGYNL